MSEPSLEHNPSLTQGRIRRLNRYFKPYRSSYLLGTLFLTLSNFFLVWIPVLIRKTMDEVEALRNLDSFEGVPLTQILFSSEAGSILASNSLLLILNVLLYGVLLFATRQTLIVSSRNVEYDIRNEFIQKLVSLPQRYFASHSSGEIYVRGTEDVSRVREYFGPVFMYNINTLTRAGFVITMMFIVNLDLTLWALLPLPFLAVFAYWISTRIHSYQTLIQEQYSILAGKAQEVFSSIRLIKAFSREEYESEQFAEESMRYKQKKLRLDLVESLFHPSLNFMIGLSVLLVIWVGGRMVMDGQVTVGNITEFVIYVAYLTWPIASLGYTLNILQKSLASWDRLTSFFDEPIDEIPILDGVSVPAKEGWIELDHVSFIYPGAKQFALEGISMSIPPGKKVAIVGKTGSGKTTLAELIPRLFDPTEGTIKISGRDLKDWDPVELRQQIGYVPQETFLFSATIGENIAFGVENPTTDQIRKAAQSAQILENILEFDKKFETITGERGITLSGGQKQRTAIARALIKEPSIVILDDSLSAVDTKTENEILKYLHQELKDKTVITVSHRISTIQNSDIIYVLKEGRIVETGSHTELLAKQGIYHSMYKKQLLEKELAEI